MPEEVATIGGYRLGKALRDTELCTSHRAEKDGAPYFFKIYRYERDGSCSARAHQATQQRLAGALARMGKITETLVDHGFVADPRPDPLFQSEIYYQVKTWLEVEDLKAWLKARNAAVLAQIKGGELDAARVALQQRLELARNLMGVIKGVHALGVVHQDLKPEQFLVLTPEPVPLPQIADFDWSFFEGEMPLRGVATPGYESCEHLSGAARVRASDVFTMGRILFEMLTLGVGGHPLISPEEMAKEITPAQLAGFVARGRYCRSLAALYSATFGEVGLDLAALERLDALIGGCLKPLPAERPTAAAAWEELQALQLFSTEPPAIRPAATGYGGLWFRLQVPDEELEAWTIREGAEPEHLRLDKATAKAMIRSLADVDGDPLYRYLNGDGRPWVEFNRIDGGWHVRAGEKATNGCMLVSVSADPRLLGSEWVPVHLGDRLQMYSSKAKAVVAGLELVVAGPKS